MLALAQPAVTGAGAELWVFVIVGGLALGSALSMVLMRNAVHAALMLVVNFFAIAVLYATLEAQFLAVVQIIVYAGAIVVLFLFVLMLLGVGGTEAFTERIAGQKTAAVVLGLALFGVLAVGVVAPFSGAEFACNVAGDVDGEPAVEAAGAACEGLAAANAEGNVRGVGLLLFTDYVWPFEVTSALLVVAALGAMVLGKRRDDPAELSDAPPPALPEPSPEDVGVDADGAGTAATATREEGQA